MRYFLIFLPVTLLYLVLKSALVTTIPLPDVPLLMVFYVAYRHGGIWGAVFGFATGYAEDAFTGGIYGVTSFSLVTVFLAVHLLAKKVHFSTPGLKAGAAFFLSLMKGVVMYALLNFTGFQAFFLWRIVLQAMFTGIFASAAISMLQRLEAMAGSRTFER